EAIQWFEDIIQSPPAFEDSLFAIIDLGYTYLLMQQGGYKSGYTGNLPQHKPESLVLFRENRDYLLSLLQPKSSGNEENTVQAKGLASGILGQNIPNPFRGSTIVPYEITKHSKVQFMIYDQAGRQIKEYRLGEKVAGTFKFTIDGSGLKPGVYFITLKTNGTVSGTKKMVVY
ncbi:MAG: T9SS type A sorting domain-containing protein, partial [Bacteroidales bacterium]|nr:T9SS type A sorting domain-containing protein [Bacteroidales bacterium]